MMDLIKDFLNYIYDVLSEAAFNLKSDQWEGL